MTGKEDDASLRFLSRCIVLGMMRGVNSPETSPRPRRESANISAVFTKVERSGRWLVEPDTAVRVVFGRAELDFRQAVLSSQEVTVAIRCLFGGVTVKIPPGVKLDIASLTPPLGGFAFSQDQNYGQPGDDAPTIRLSGSLLLGKLDIRRDQAV